jgi:hypothetical protein
MSNKMMVLAPYFLEKQGTWVFDDERVGLVHEPFVAGIPQIIEHVVRDIPNAKSGFRLLFSSSPFPDYQIKLEWLREEFDGNWYRESSLEMEGWLCPALFCYFTEAPQELYVKAEAIS